MKTKNGSRRIFGILLLTLLILGGSVFLFSCGKEQENKTKEKSDAPLASKAPAKTTSMEKSPTAKLPEEIEWLTNDSDPVFGSPKAIKGGTLHETVLSFPMTLRLVGPDSNGSFAGVLRSNQLSLIGIHPNTLNIVPELATHWAYGKDKKTMYFKLNEKARWSDGQPVTANDYAYTLEFMRSKYIVAPWYNDYYTKEIDRVIVYDDYTLAVVGTKAEPDLYLKLGMAPTPRHFFGELNADFVKKYNWEIEPNTGPYQIEKFEKGKNLRLKRKQDWWAADLTYFKNRFNVDEVIFEVVRDTNIQWEYFKKARLDSFGMTIPQYWHEKSDTGVVNKGYVHKIWFYNDTQRSAQGLWLNQDREIFKDPDVRYAFAHAMNIEKVIEQVLRNDYERLESGFVGYGPYSNNTIRARRYDLEKVKELMTASGWHRGNDGIWEKGDQRFSVEVVYTVDEHTARLVVLKEEAKKAGVELNLQKLDASASFKKVLEKKHDVAWMGWSTSLRPQFWEHFHSINAHKPQTNNITNTDDPEMDKLIDAHRNSLDEKERITLSLKIQEKIHEIGCFVPTFMVPYVREGYWRWWRLPDVPGTKQTESLFDAFSSSTGGLFWYDKDLHDQTLSAMESGQTFDPVTRTDETYRMKP
ncbi:MAG: ABC transporter substrate-binding protein [Desulfobacteraceae bacterium]|nr:ABC transporter substrate-binding protein [Desulfobacteraceae bacterium]